MPRRKKTLPTKPEKEVEVIEHPTPRQGITSYARSSYKWAESYTSLLMGVVVIIIAVLFVVSLIRATHHVQDTSSTATGPAPTTTAVGTPRPSTGHTRVYTVESGDDLWDISVKVYGSGYNWVDIAKANNLSDPSTIFAGDKLTLPTLTAQQTQPQPAQGQVSQIITQKNNQAITGNSYTVVYGDTLWDIAVRAYGDGYKWTEIASTNNLSNPDLIFSGNVFTIPR